MNNNRLPSLPNKFLLLIIGLILIPFICHAQWLEWEDLTSSNLTVSTVANSDDEEKDISAADLNKDGWTDIVVVRKEPFSDWKASDYIEGDNSILDDTDIQYNATNHVELKADFEVVKGATFHAFTETV